MARRKNAATKPVAIADPLEPRQAPSTDEPVAQKERSRQHRLPGDCSSKVTYYPRQYGGTTLGLVSCLGTAAFYDQMDPWRVYKLVAWLMLALVALLIHENRPYRRMNYGDVAEQS